LKKIHFGRKTFRTILFPYICNKCSCWNNICTFIWALLRSIILYYKAIKVHNHKLKIDLHNKVFPVTYGPKRINKIDPRSVCIGIDDGKFAIVLDESLDRGRSQVQISDFFSLSFLSYILKKLPPCKHPG
jgi:hypothetical protein